MRSSGPLESQALPDWRTDERDRDREGGPKKDKRRSFAGTNSSSAWLLELGRLVSQPFSLPPVVGPQDMRRHARRHDYRNTPAQVLNGGEETPSLTITMLGAGQEVGRSCCVIEHRGKKVVCDAGLHPAYPGMGSLPFIDELDWSTVDAILVTQ